MHGLVAPRIASGIMEVCWTDHPSRHDWSNPVCSIFNCLSPIPGSLLRLCNSCIVFGFWIIPFLCAVVLILCIRTFLTCRRYRSRRNMGHPMVPRVFSPLAGRSRIPHASEWVEWISTALNSILVFLCLQWCVDLCYSLKSPKYAMRVTPIVISRDQAF
ncbi:hypothetical protein J3A83DRAFT_979905 [Scleroderma citrinum]